MATRGMNASFRELRGMIEMRYKYGAGDPDADTSEDECDQASPAELEAEPEAGLEAGPETSEKPAQCEANVPQADGDAEEVEAPVDVNPPLSPWERVPEGRVRASAPPSAPASPETQVRAGAPPSAPASPDSPEEHEAIRAGYQTRLDRVRERLEQDEAAGPAELDPAARDRPPPGPGTETVATSTSNIE
jgi:hypothetical protein